jgi:hypothetical protein
MIVIAGAVLFGMQIRTRIAEQVWAGIRKRLAGWSRHSAEGVWLLPPIRVRADRGRDG